MLVVCFNSDLFQVRNSDVPSWTVQQYLGTQRELPRFMRPGTQGWSYMWIWRQCLPKYLPDEAPHLWVSLWMIRRNCKNNLLCVVVYINIICLHSITVATYIIPYTCNRCQICFWNNCFLSSLQDLGGPKMDFWLIPKDFLLIISTVHSRNQRKNEM